MNNIYILMKIKSFDDLDVEKIPEIMHQTALEMIGFRKWDSWGLETDITFNRINRLFQELKEQNKDVGDEIINLVLGWDMNFPCGEEELISLIPKRKAIISKIFEVKKKNKEKMDEKTRGIK